MVLRAQQGVQEVRCDEARTMAVTTMFFSSWNDDRRQTELRLRRRASVNLMLLDSIVKENDKVVS